MILDVKWRRLHPDAVLPDKAHADDAGFDLVCVEDCEILPGETVDVHSGIAIAMPTGWWGRIIGRSSTLRKRGLLVNEGVIDAGFRGELFTCVHNLGWDPVQIKSGERLAQLLFLPVPAIEWELVEQLPESERGSLGFGSSGQ